MSLLAEVVWCLEGRRVPHCLIGAAALAVHGAPRATMDVDLLVVERAVLEHVFWDELARAITRTIRGDSEDPLAGAVRFERTGEPEVDVVVGKWRWQKEALGRTATKTVFGITIPVADPGDIILLKLDAGGPQDHYDIISLLRLGGPSLRATVEERLKDAPSSLAREWTLKHGEPQP